MLGPQDRRLLLDALRPPDGYSLDFAIGTSYSLDLLAMLTAPLAFTFFDWEDAEGRPNPDPLALLEALRRHADRITIFCQAGQILVPKQHRVLFGYLEDSVFEVMPNFQGASFHPKFWAIRFVAAGEPVRYRVLCLSRNLTFDRSWDTALVLDGKLVDRKTAFSGNHPLGDFVASLHAMAVRKVPKSIRERVEQCAYELRRVEVELPEGFDEFSYRPLGHNGKGSWPFGDRYDRLLVVSPFLSEGVLESLSDSAKESILISRLECLAEIGKETLSRFESVYALNPSAEVEESQASEGAESAEEEPRAPGDPPGNGLHAKLYIAERGWKASVFTGSANATSAAFERNVEFMVELMGKKSQVGIDSFLRQSDGNVTFYDLLEPYSPSDDVTEPDPVIKELEEMVEEVKRAIIALKIAAHVSELPTKDHFQINLETQSRKSPVIPKGVRVCCWPITLRETDACDLSVGAQPLASFSSVSFVALSSFFAFEVVAAKGQKSVSARFALNLPLIGAPTNRRERILRSLLSDPEKVLRFLMFLLSEFGSNGFPTDIVDELEWNGKKLRPAWQSFAVFESLLRALDRSPEKLDQVARLVEDLRDPDGSKSLMPEGFEKVWEPIWEARQRIKP